jgi:hypothetical protein
MAGGAVEIFVLLGNFNSLLCAREKEKKNTLPTP